MKGQELGIWIYFRGDLIGPIDFWELKLISSKYRDFHIFVDQGWVNYKSWKSDPGLKTTYPDSLPDRMQKYQVSFLRVFKRRVLGDCH